jgi:hypothetical protein
MPNVGQELLNVPFPEMVQKLALAVATGQTALDKNSIATAKALATTKIQLPDIDDPEGAPIKVSLIALGIYPQFYQFSTAEIEVKMAITMAQSTDISVDVTVGVDYGCFSASVNASYSQKYSYNVEGSSRLYMKLNPVPPPTILQNYMNALTQAMLQKDDAKKIAKADPTLIPSPP